MDPIRNEEAVGLSYVFPASEEIVIQKSDLQIQLEKFKERIKASFSVFDVLAIVSLWAPTFSAEFKSISVFTSGEVRMGYIVFSIMMTAFILYSRTFYRFFNFWKKDKVNDDSEKMAQKILEQCKSKPKSG